MAHIRLRINHKEYELEGSEEFIREMEPKLTAFLEQHLADVPHPAPEPPIQPTGAPAFAPAATAADDAYIKGFLERYNNFNELTANKK